MANTWNEAGTTWGTNRWGTTNEITQGWGADSWGTGGSWGQATDELVPLTGLSATSALGSITVVQRPGWGTLDWGENGWGTVESAVLNLTAPTEMTSSVGAITPADVVGLTGQEATSSVGEFTFILSPTITPTGQVATVSEGQFNINNGADHTQGLTTLVGTTAVGSITLGIGVPLTGVEATSSVGEITTSDAQVTNLTGVGATSSVGSIVTGIGVPLTGVSATVSVGTISPADVMGLTGQEATAEVGTTGFGTIAYKDIDITGITSYTDVTHVA
jgi:hypothetical protein|tara:strand:- start:12 stop:836 length:825 start_codon:yes stop_codon:yes gene_type:complete